MIDLNLYVEIVEFFDGLEYEEKWMGGGEAAYEWFLAKYGRTDPLDYTLQGVACLAGHPKGHGWNELPRNDELDREVWTFHRVWIDRYGWESTMQQGKERQERQTRALRGEK